MLENPDDKDTDAERKVLHPGRLDRLDGEDPTRSTSVVRERSSRDRFRRTPRPDPETPRNQDRRDPSMCDPYLRTLFL